MADEDNKEAAHDDAAPASDKPAPVSTNAEATPASSKSATNGSSPPPAALASTGHAAHASAAHAAAPGSTHGHAHGAGAHGDGHGHGLAHTMPVPMLLGVLAALMVLTILTVSVTNFDLGAQGNLVVAMVIATIKAGLVVAFFMHLVWDKKLHLLLFLTSVLFLILFLSLSVNDRGEYQHDIDAFQNSAAK